MTLKHTLPNGRRVWKCDICGTEDIWENSDWWACCSLLDEDTLNPVDIPTVCSDECKDAFEKRLSAGLLQVPRATMQGYHVSIKGKREGY